MRTGPMALASRIAITALTGILFTQTGCGPDNPPEPPSEQSPSDTDDPCPNLRELAERRVDVENERMAEFRDELEAEKSEISRLAPLVPYDENLPALPTSRLGLIGSWREVSMPADPCTDDWQQSVPFMEKEVRLDPPISFTWSVATAELLANMSQTTNRFIWNRGVLNTVHGMAPLESGGGPYTISPVAEALGEGAKQIGESENLLARWATPVVITMLPNLNPETSAVARAHLVEMMEVLTTEDFRAWSKYVDEEEAHRTACEVHRELLPVLYLSSTYEERENDPRYIADKAAYEAAEAGLPPSCRDGEWTAEELQDMPPVPKVNPGPGGRTYGERERIGPMGDFLRRWRAVESRKQGDGNKLHAAWLYWGVMAGHELRDWHTCQWVDAALEQVNHAQPLLAEMYRGDLQGIIDACPKKDAEVTPQELARELREARGEWTPNPPPPMPTGVVEERSSNPPTDP